VCIGAAACSLKEDCTCRNDITKTIAGHFSKVSQLKVHQQLGNQIRNSPIAALCFQLVDLGGRMGRVAHVHPPPLFMAVCITIASVRETVA
jgi:hypothetical protein